MKIPFLQRKSMNQGYRFFICLISKRGIAPCYWQIANKIVNIGIFGGSFNPIHIGHLALANYLCEYGEVDEVWFLVSPHNPLKERGDLWPDELRLQLVQIAIDGYKKFRASDFEFHLPRPSYMVNTLRALRESYPEHEFTLIIGSDNWKFFLAGTNMTNYWQKTNC